MAKKIVQIVKIKFDETNEKSYSFSISRNCDIFCNDISSSINGELVITAKKEK